MVRVLSEGLDLWLQPVELVAFAFDFYEDDLVFTDTCQVGSSTFREDPQFVDNPRFWSQLSEPFDRRIPDFLFGRTCHDVTQFNTRADTLFTL